MTSNEFADAATDAELIRYLDGELDEAERTRMDAALAHDPALAGRLETLRRRNARLRALLNATDPSEAEVRAAHDAIVRAHATGAAVGIERGATIHSIEAVRQSRARRDVPPPASGSHWLRAAAVIAALLAAGLLVPPVRAWIVDRIESLGTEVEPDVGASPDTRPVEAGPVIYTIPVTGPTLEILVDAVQAAGELTVRVADVTEATIEPLGAAADPVLVVPGGSRVRVQSGTASTAGYRLTLPSSVTTLRVRIGGGPARTFELDPAAGRVITIPLTDASA